MTGTWPSGCEAVSPEIFHPMVGGGVPSFSMTFTLSQSLCGHIGILSNMAVMPNKRWLGPVPTSTFAFKSDMRSPLTWMSASSFYLTNLLFLASRMVIKCFVLDYERLMPMLSFLPNILSQPNETSADACRLLPCSHMVLTTAVLIHIHACCTKDIIGIPFSMLPFTILVFICIWRCQQVWWLGSPTAPQISCRWLGMPSSHVLSSWLVHCL
jgi:hypothetical protein